jgi:hypothetical protein
MRTLRHRAIDESLAHGCTDNIHRRWWGVGDISEKSMDII